jgi:tRNA pseudouridine38-40 synthase
MRIALAVEYVGTAFHGWQSQPDGNTVQDALERALAAIAGAAVGALAAGRTDTGVHATMQIVHFDAPVSRPDTAWVRGVNANLPADIAVQWAQPVAADFHARFAARTRHYSYVLANRAVRPALLAGRVGWYHRPLDVGAMVRAAEPLAGTHDFSAFRAAECQARTPVKTLAPIAILAQGDFIQFDFSANAFLHHMVRNIVGALVAVGAGKAPESAIAALLNGRDRTRSAPTFAPDGLYLTGADYDAKWALPVTRRPLQLLLGAQSR